MSNSKHVELLELSRGKLDQARGKVSQLGKEAGLGAKEQLVLIQTARLGAAVMSLANLAQTQGGPYADELSERLDAVTVNLATLGSTALAREKDILADPEAAADRLSTLVSSAIRIIMEAMRELSKQIKEDDGLVQAAREVNERRRSDSEGTLQ